MITPDENNSIFQLATDFINETSEHLFLTGKAGTGKTTFLRHIRKQTHKTALVAAPTGVAAINAGGITLHSLFQLPFEPYLPGISTLSSQKNFFRFTKQKLDLLRQLELLIIDEVSMLRADTLDAIDASLRGIRRNPRPFGGVQVLYIGDMFQLPPVAKDDEWQLLKEYYSSTFFFHAKVIQQTQPVYLELKKVYRQGDPVFVDLLNRVRNNVITASDIQELNRHYDPQFIPSDEEKYITLTTHNYKADQINNRKLEELQTPERIFTGEVKGEFPDYSLPTDMQLRLKEGAQVMFLRNDTMEPRRYYNGKIATISRIVADQIYVYIPENNTEILLQKEIWENMRYSLNKESGGIVQEQLGSFTQFPIRLAWAITIHKSQGLTFEKAIIDIGASFAPGQAYVALSRCTSLDGIVLHSRVQPNCIMTDPHAIRFSQTEKAREELEDIFSRGKRKFWAERLLLYFDWRPMYLILKEMEKFMEDKVTEEYLPLSALLSRSHRTVRELEETAFKFQDQLTRLVQQEGVGEDLPVLKERCTKAVAYFYEQFIDQILKPLQEYIHYFKSPKKAKTFYKNIIAIEEDMILFLENMKRVRYNNIPLADGPDLVVPRRKDLFTTDAQAEKLPKKRKSSGEKIEKVKPEKEKKEKISTYKMSLTLYKEGLSIEKIAEQRTLAVSTIEGHLASFIASGELSVEEFFSPQELEEIHPVLETFIEMEYPPFRTAVEQLKGKYTYGQLRMAFNHIKQLKQKELSQ